MSKAKGQKIVVKFNKALLGDVTGNHTAFTVTGQQKNPLHTGAPELTEYTVDSVERYPVATLYEDDFTGAMDGVEVGVNGVVLESGEEVENAIPVMTSNADPAGVASASSRIADTYMAWKALNRTNVGTTDCWHSDATFPHWLQYEFDTTIRATSYSITTRDNATNIRAPKSWNLLGSNDGVWWDVLDERADAFATEIQNETKVFDITSPGDYSVYRIHITSGHHGGYVAIGMLGLGIGAEYLPSGTYTTTIPADTLPTNPRLKWTEDLPTGTSIAAEYAINQDALTTPTTWTAIANNDLLTIPSPATGYFLWLKFTLATTDTTVTPTLLSVWLEEAEAPPDTIILNFDTYNRFNDVEGDITVAYDQATGTLAGDAAVASFSVPFAPTDLLKTPIDEHTISVGITEVAVNLLPVTYIEAHTDHTVSVGVTEVTVALIHVDDINP